MLTLECSHRRKTRNELKDRENFFSLDEGQMVSSFRPTPFDLQTDVHSTPARETGEWKQHLRTGDYIPCICLENRYSYRF